MLTEDERVRRLAKNGSKYRVVFLPATGTPCLERGGKTRLGVSEHPGHQVSESIRELVASRRPRERPIQALAKQRRPLRMSEQVERLRHAAAKATDRRVLPVLVGGRSVKPLLRKFDDVAWVALGDPRQELTQEVIVKTVRDGEQVDDASEGPRQESSRTG